MNPNHEANILQMRNKWRRKTAQMREQQRAQARAARQQELYRRLTADITTLRKASPDEEVFWQRVDEIVGEMRRGNANA